MNTYKRHRFSPDIISYAVWLYYRFNFSHRRNAGPLIEDYWPSAASLSATHTPTDSGL